MTIAAALNREDSSACCAGISPCWTEISQAFSCDRERLAAYLAKVAAEVLAEVKPANLVRLVDRHCEHWQDLESLWRRYGAELLAESPLEAIELPDDKSGVLLMIYRPTQLATRLEDHRTRHFLRRLDYPAQKSWFSQLKHLAWRFQQTRFPHEIGVFLGYPLKDVAGFLGWGGLRQSASGPWKIYGNPTPSLNLIESHRVSRQWILHRLKANASPQRLLNGMAS